jgi:hypothetical protein
MSHTNAFSVCATVLKINTGIYQIRRYHFGDVTKAVSELGTFSSEIEAQQAFYKAFPNGALAEENRHGIVSMPNREIARNYTRLRKGWSVKDNGKDAGVLRWACVKTYVTSEQKESQPVAEFLAA